MAMNNVRQIFQNRFTNLGKRTDKNEDRTNFALPPYTDNLYQSAKANKEICNDIYKKMANVCVINYNTSEDKKAKKNSWETLSNVIGEAEKKISDDSLTKEILNVSVKTFDDLSRNTKEFEKSISSNVIKNFQELSEDNGLSSTKKAMTSLSKDMKANSEKVLSLQEQINNQNSDNISNRKSMDISGIGSAESKLVNAQLAEENNEKEFELKRDLYLSKLFCLESEKIIVAEKMLEFFKEHLEYYIECKNILTKCIPELQLIIEDNKKNFVFHLSLEEHIASTNRKLSYVLETCIRELDNEESLQEEGLFRISGSKNKVELLKNALNVMRADDYIIKSCDSSVFAGVLKQYLRELPIPLMTFQLYDKWCEVGSKIKNNDVEGAKSQIKECLSLMPICYLDNLVYLMEFLKKISLNEYVNKMSSSNLALMLGPNLIRNKQANENEESDASRVMMLGSPGPGVLDFMITYCYDIFPNIPVYTASKQRILTTSNLKTSDRDVEGLKISKSPRNCGDSDSLSSADILSDDSANQMNSSTFEQKSDSIKSSKETTIRLKAPRKPPAPPPPVPKVQITDVDVENPSDEPKTRDKTDRKPMIKKRTSILEKSISEKHNFEIPHGESSIRRGTSANTSFKPSQPPSIPLKKPTVLPTVLSTPENPEKARPKVESAPPKRPSNPPPPIPPFEKLKETLDQKSSENPPSKPESRKPSLPTNDTSKSTELEPGSIALPEKIRDSGSDSAHQSTVF